MPGKKDRKRDRGGGGRSGGLAGLGMFGVPEMPTTTDDDLEAELLALTGGKGTQKGSKKSKDSSNMSMADIDKMLASVKDIGEDDDGGDDVDDSDIDDDDLLAELQDLQDNDDDDDIVPVVVNPPPIATKPVKPVSSPQTSSGDLLTVQTRLQTYKTAIAAANSKGDTSKARRYERGLKTLQGMIKSLEAGKKIYTDDIPPDVSISVGGVAPIPTKVPPNIQEEEDDMAELASWAGSTPGQSQPHVPISSATQPRPTPPTRTSDNVSIIQDRLVMYQEAMRVAETSRDSTKIRRYKRAIGTIQDMLKAAKGGRPITSMDDLPPPITTAVKPVTELPPKQPPTVSVKPIQSTNRPGNLIDLDAPEFDEFNLSEEDMASLEKLMFVDNKDKPHEPPVKTTPIKQPPVVAPSPQKPVCKPQPSSSSARPPGLIDLDTPEFAEFDLSDADLEMLANTLVDDRKKETPMVTTTQSLPSRPPVQKEERPLTKDLVLEVLSERKEQYMTASHKARSHGDDKTRKQYGLVAVNFKRAIESVSAGTPIDLKGIPPPPPGFPTKYNIDISSYGAPASNPRPPTTTTPQSSVSSQPTAEDEEEAVDTSIPVPKTPLEALTQRLDKYKEGLKNAQEKGESSRVRRTSRIIKQYEEAIKMTRAGKPYDLSELPTPPGFPPIPTGGGTKPPAAASRPAPVSGRPHVPQPSQSLPPLRLIPSVSDQQLKIIQDRAGEFLTVVKQAKAKGDRDKALTYMRYYKSIQQMLQAAEGGLPVDLSQLPPSPFADPSKATATKNILSHLGPIKEGDDKTFDLIELQLEQQLDVCKTNGDLYQKLGNLAASSQHKNLADQCQRDLLAIKGIRSQNLAPPKFTMEMREFAIVHSHPDISDKQVEVELIRGITIPAPSGYTEEDINIYTEIEFPWPQDAVQKFQTHNVKESSNPEYKETCLFDIDRKQGRSLLRIFKRHPLKCSVYQHRTLRKDIFIGLVSVPLETLETKCEVHVTEDLKDEKGRKSIGGKLEVKVRLREPLSGRDQEVKNQKWLVFQEAIATEPSVKMLQPSAATGSTGPGGVTSPIKIEQTTSIEALKLELSIVQNALKAGKRDPATLQRGQAIQSRMKVVKQKLQDPGFKREYIMTISKEMKMDRALEQQLIQMGKTGEAKVIQGRRKMMENELSKFQK